MTAIHTQSHEMFFYQAFLFQQKDLPVLEVWTVKKRVKK